MLQRAHRMRLAGIMDMLQGPGAGRLWRRDGDMERDEKPVERHLYRKPNFASKTWEQGFTSWPTPIDSAPS